MPPLAAGEASERTGTLPRSLPSPPSPPSRTTALCSCRQCRPGLISAALLSPAVGRGERVDGTPALAPAAVGDAVVALEADVCPNPWLSAPGTESGESNTPLSVAAVVISAEVAVAEASWPPESAPSRPVSPNLPLTASACALPSAACFDSAVPPFPAGSSRPGRVDLRRRCKGGSTNCGAAPTSSSAEFPAGLPGTSITRITCVWICIVVAALIDRGTPLRFLAGIEADFI